MRLFRALTLSISASALVAQAGCGGSDEQPEWPDITVVDQSADDMGLAEPRGEPTGGGEEAAAEAGGDAEPPAAPVRVVAAQRTPIEGDSPRIRILTPRAGRLVRRNVSLSIQLSNWELQAAPGRHVHVIVDNEPYIAVRDVSSPLDLNALVQQSLGHELAEGTHVVRVFPSRGHHESVKTDGAFAMVMFHYRSRTADFSFDPAAPLLTYSRPKGCSNPGSRLLLDFYVANTELAADGSRVHFWIDSAVEGDITAWAPHFIENLSIGTHRIRLQLRDAHGGAVPGPFNDTEREIRVATSCE